MGHDGPAQPSVFNPNALHPPPAAPASPHPGDRGPGSPAEAGDLRLGCHRSLLPQGGHSAAGSPRIVRIIHLRDSRGEPTPASYRSAFLQAGETSLLSVELSRSLALGAGLRHILVREYEEIDYRLMHGSLPRILDHMARFIEECLPCGARSG